MGLQKYRADYAEEMQADGATPWCTRWVGGPSLALIRNAPTEWGARTVYITAAPDTFFSIPAAVTVKGRTVRGYVTTEARNGRAELVFRPMTAERERMNAYLAARSTAST